MQYSYEWTGLTLIMSLFYVNLLMLLHAKYDIFAFSFIIVLFVISNDKINTFLR